MAPLTGLGAGRPLAAHLLSQETSSPARSPTQPTASRPDHPLLWAVGLLALTLILTTATAWDWRLSLFGSVDRAQGLLTQLSQLLLFLLVAARLRTVDQARSNLYATLGRANFVGAYLAMLLPLPLALGWTAPGWRRRFFLAVTLAMALVIGMTQARGAWLAAGVGLGLFVLLARWSR